MRPLIAALPAYFLATALAAQEGVGTISGTLDLDPARWVVAGAGDGATSSFSSGDDGIRVTVIGTPESGSERGEQMLTIEMQLDAGAIEANLNDARIELQRTDEVLFAEDDNVDLTITAFERAGAQLAVAGSFVAVLTPETQDGVVINTEEGVTLDGNFQATIPAVSDG